MKKLISMFLVAGLMICGMVVNASAGTSDTFGISASIDNTTLSITLQDTAETPGDYTTWAIGSKAVNTATTMTSAQGIKIVVVTSFPIDINAAAGTSAGGGSWTADTAAGSSKYKLELKPFSAQEATPSLESGATVIAATATEFDPIVSSGSRWAYAKFTTPTVTTSGAAQTVTVTITAVVH